MQQHHSKHARAVVEFHRSAPRLPVVSIHICAGDGAVTIRYDLAMYAPTRCMSTHRVMDQGGGIPEADLQRVWQYGYTTIRESTPSSNIGATRGGEGLGVSFGDVWSDVRCVLFFQCCATK